VPIDALLARLPDLVRVEFDQDLNVAALNTLNWQVRVNNVLYRPATAAVETFSRRAARLYNLIPGFGDMGPNAVSFSPPPFDVVSSESGLPAAAFAEYPLHD